MWSLVPLLLVPLVIMLAMRAVVGARFTWKELLLLEVVAVALLGLGFWAAQRSALSDTEFWSGRLTSKVDDSMSCCHCHQECDTCTRTDSKGRTSTYQCQCREVCAHSRDYYWALDFSTGDRITVNRCEPNRGRVPELWSRAVVGEPAAIPHSYQNYLLADRENSVLVKSADPTDVASVPSYPQGYGLYRVDRAINAGTSMPVAEWNDGLDDLNADLGGKKQVNVVVLATTRPSATYAQAVEAAWLYGKKNDVIFVLGAPDGDRITWAEVVTISEVAELQVAARHDLPGHLLTDVQGTIGLIRTQVAQKFVRTPMANFEYLASAAQPSNMALVLLYLASIILSVGGALFLREADPFGDDGFGLSRYR